jgi:YidC/Oxa1 family membrane protein insertase
MMDKKTIYVVMACMAALFGWQMLVNKLYPPRPKAARPATVTATDAVTNVTATAAATNELPKLSAPVTVPVERPAEQTVTLTNDRVRVTFTSWGGGIKSVELLRYKAETGHVILEQNAAQPALSLQGLAAGEGAYEFVNVTANRVTLRGQLANGTTVTKEITLGTDYRLHGTVRLSGAPPATIQLVIGQATQGNEKEELAFVAVDWLAQNKYQTRPLPKLWSLNVKQQYSEPATTPWGAVKNQFFTMVLTPATNAVTLHYHPHRLPTPLHWSGKIPHDSVTAALELPAAVQGGEAVWEFDLYAGPKEYDRLVALKAGQEYVMDFGMFGIFSVWLLKGMNFFHRLLPNYGIAIIIITILIKLLFWPIQAKSLKSMKEMQKFQPLMAKIREKYKDNMQKQNEELMKLYKEHKINPFSGCLPMLVQIPVFFALFAMLRSAIELRGASFLWIADLSRPDTIFHLAGLPINPLPLLMTASSVWQMKLTPQTGDSQQQKMMMFMPLIFLFMFYGTAAGLVLYWTVQQLLSVAQQWYSLRQPATATVIKSA